MAADAGLFDPQTAKFILETAHEFHRMRNALAGQFKETSRKPMTFIKIPTAGIAAATASGATPSVTSNCVVYRNTGTNGALVKQTVGGADYVIDVYHYGAAIDTLANHDFQYLQVIRTHVGWVVSVEYCDA